MAPNQIHPVQSQPHTTRPPSPSAVPDPRNVTASTPTAPGKISSGRSYSSYGTAIDQRQLTIEGFRSLGIMATFFAGLQAQMLCAALSRESSNSTTAARLTSAFWLAGIFLDVFGAVLATLTARWFEVLDAGQVDIMNKTWTATPTTAPPTSIVAWVIATALFSSFGIVAFGVSMFLLGLLIYVWDTQPFFVSVISTAPFLILAPLVAGCFYPLPEKEDIIRILAEKRGRW